MLEAPAAQSLVRRLENGGVLSVPGVSPAAQSFLAAWLHQRLPQLPLVVVSDSLKTQEYVLQDISTWLAVNGESSARPLFYPAWEILPHESRLPHSDVIGDRLETLISLLHYQREPHSPAPIVVASVTALLQRTFKPESLLTRTRTFSRGDRIDPLDLAEWLEEQAYEPEAQVSQKGELALRGGILDVYPIASPWPARIEFFGDEIESIRYFDPITQVSRDEIQSVTLGPGGELGILKRLLQSRNESSEFSPDAPVGPATKQQEGLALLFEHLPPRTIFLLAEPELLKERADEYAAQVPVGDLFFTPWRSFLQAAVTNGMTLLNVSESIFEQQAFDEPPMDLQSLEAFRPLLDRAPEPQVAETQRREFFAQLHRWLRQEYAVHVFCNNDGERQRFGEIWKDYGFGSVDEMRVSSEASLPQDNLLSASANFPEAERASQAVLHVGALSRGFISDQGKIVVVTDAEIFGRYRVQRPRRLKSPHAQATRSALDINFAEMEEGDFVVHLQHGIGRYLGLKILPIGSGTKPLEAAQAAASSGQECLVIEYAPGDPTQESPRLYVPVSEAHLVSKYIGTGKARPMLNTLGGTRWAKAKAQAERAVRDVASDLLSIQAARETQAGHPFAADSAWQREFEASFIYEETPDQMRAILDTKSDMERPKPMDRLICGDVGFGKTEVAIRATFKAVMDGKQAAVLVPTTVLAQQHFNTFRERMADYPVRVELLSRFRTRRAQQRVVTDLGTGAVDIVIGTHRLLQNDIQFKELGLVVIDEEQRFGVAHKEKFKMLRRLIDVLTLSATPIPRTLYLALAGARDMSTIQTPPHDRLPVETIVVHYDERLIRDAIQREINRGGQVFFLHNRVMTIHTMAQKLQTLVPNARIVVGHGQMHSDDLEEVMTRFINGEADVLLSTTIIESGLDIPNANTIIIDRADRFGLSDLYQLRGRVGRYKHQAYAYLLLPRHARLLTDVRKRMSAIKQYSTLGSGFKIAMRDLEIRGAGNLLGAEQSGHITAVGFELYCQLLKYSVAALKGENLKPRVEVQVRLDFLTLSSVGEFVPGSEERLPGSHGVSGIASASIPLSYIPEAVHRIEMYRKLAQIEEVLDLGLLRKEMRDRFGPVPDAVERLLLVAELKLLAGLREVTSIEVKDDKVMLSRNNDYVMLGNKFPRLSRKTPDARLKEIKKLLLALQAT
jgi:transcription-repair coupling factor (superfamily II helicase)